MATLPNLTLSHVPVTSSIAGATPSINSPSSLLDDASKKVRKPYTISKSRESWTDPEHDKFLEAIQLFDRDWKKIEAFIGSKTVIQIRSHAQKYFLKVQKSGVNEHLPPPRPKRKSAHPYPQKASKSGEDRIYFSSSLVVVFSLALTPTAFTTPPVISHPPNLLAVWDLSMTLMISVDGALQ